MQKKKPAKTFFNSYSMSLQAYTGQEDFTCSYSSMVIGGFVAILLWTNRPDYQVLFSNLATDDAAKITEKLKELRVPFQLKEGGSAVLVPDEMVYQLRLDLAGEGLPRGNNVGFEIFDDIVSEPLNSSKSSNINKPFRENS